MICSLFPPCPAWHNSISWWTNLQSAPSSGFSSTTSTGWDCLWEMHSLYRYNQRITADPHACIIWHLGHHAAYKYMVEKEHHISPIGFALINFPALSASLKSAPPLYWLWFSKFVSGHSTTGCMMYLWKNGIMPSALVVVMTQKQPSMFSSALTLIYVLKTAPSC